MTAGAPAAGGGLIGDPRGIRDRLDDARRAGCEEELPRLIAIEAAHLAGRGSGPSPLVEALLEMERPDLAPLAADLHCRAAAEAAADATQELLAERSPVFVWGDTVVAMPVGGPEEEARGRIADRLLALALRARPRRARLVLDFAGDAARAPAAWASLVRDLGEQGIPLEVRAPAEADRPRMGDRR